jgi:hypothetical protein
MLFIQNIMFVMSNTNMLEVLAASPLREGFFMRKTESKASAFYPVLL